MSISKTSKSVVKYSHLVDMMTNTQDPAKATTTTKASQKTSNPFQRHQVALLGRRTKGSITQRNIRGKAFQFRYEGLFSKSR